ncbi:MAG TPA: hypothetical protein VIM96_08695 [Pseudomonadales bacterium]
MKLLQSTDRLLGRFILRCCAVAAFLAAAATAVFGVMVLINGHFSGLLILSAAALFCWLGRLAWRDRAGLGDLLSRDFEPADTKPVKAHERKPL